MRNTKLANATPGTIRLKLLKIGAQITVSLCRIKIAMAASFPFKEIFAAAHDRLAAAARA